jgi:hypothetical protein
MARCRVRRTGEREFAGATAAVVLGWLTVLIAAVTADLLDRLPAPVRADARTWSQCLAQVRASRTCWPNAPRCSPGWRPTGPGEFYLRELPPLRAVLDDLSGVMGLLVVDSYVDLDPAGRLGVGAPTPALEGV